MRARVHRTRTHYSGAARGFGGSQVPWTLVVTFLARQTKMRHVGEGARA